MGARIEAIDYCVPSESLSNETLAQEFPDWPAEKILEKTGIRTRGLARADQCASDLAVQAASQLMARRGLRAEDVDYVIFCTQSPDYLLPTTACLIQDRLGLPMTAGAVDINLGCSGYIYGLGLAKGLLETGQARSLLLLTADTYTKFINRGDKSVRTLFGDAGSATWLVDDGNRLSSSLGPFVYGTDGRGGPNLIVPTSGLRHRPTHETGLASPDAHGSVRSKDNLYMNGPEIFAFTMATIPKLVEDLLGRAGCALQDVDFVVFHQANKYMLEHLRKKLKVPESKFVISFADSGNTVSSTIPIALRGLIDRNEIKPGHRVLMAGFGVGYSWGGTLWTA